MATVSAMTGLVTVSPSERAHARVLQNLVKTPGVASALDTFWRMQPEIRFAQTSVFKARQAIHDSLAAIRPVNFELPRRTSGLDPWRIGLSKPKSVEGLRVLLAGYRNALWAALNLGIGGVLSALTLTRDRHGKTPGQIVTSHPHVTRGPNVRRSICRPSADVVRA